MKKSIGLLLLFYFLLGSANSQEATIPLDNSNMQSVVVVSTESIEAVSEILTSGSNCIDILVEITYLQQIVLVGNNQLTVHFDPNYPSCNSDSNLRESYIGYSINSRQVPFFINLTCDLSEVLQFSITQLINNQSRNIFNNTVVCGDLLNLGTLIMNPTN